MASRALDLELLEVLRASVEHLHALAIDSTLELTGSTADDGGERTRADLARTDLELAAKMLGDADRDELSCLLTSSLMSAEQLLADLRRTLAIARVAIESLPS